MLRIAELDSENALEYAKSRLLANEDWIGLGCSHIALFSEGFTQSSNRHHAKRFPPQSADKTNQNEQESSDNGRWKKKLVSRRCSEERGPFMSGALRMGVEDIKIFIGGETRPSRPFRISNEGGSTECASEHNPVDLPGNVSSRGCCETSGIFEHAEETHHFSSTGAFQHSNGSSLISKHSDSDLQARSISAFGNADAEIEDADIKMVSVMSKSGEILPNILSVGHLNEKVCIAICYIC